MVVAAMTELVGTVEAGALLRSLGVPIQHDDLYRLKAAGRGPACGQDGPKRHIVYRRSDVELWGSDRGKALAQIRVARQVARQLKAARRSRHG